MITIVIAEDHNALIEGIKLFLEYEEDVKVIGYVNNGRELLDLVEKKNPNIVITDIRMPIMDGISATKTIIKNHPKTKVIAFTMFDQKEAVEQMLGLGVSGYILKNSSMNELLSAIRAVAMGESYFDPNLNEYQSQVKYSQGTLTKRQKEILDLIVEGRTNQEIADTLFIQKVTVETHRKNMMRKLGLNGLGELMRYGLQKRYDF